MKVLTILLLLVIATPTIAAPKRKRVFKIFTPDEIERIDTPNSGRTLKGETPVSVEGSSTNMSMPTEAPSTGKPTWSPTLKWTKKPKSTWAPTTIKPTWSPTSSSPTDSPTTRSPTHRPTVRPTKNPKATKRPKATWSPTTAEPTYSPSSSEPTESPPVITSSTATAKPTESPTETASRKQATALEETNTPTLPPASVSAEEGVTAMVPTEPVGSEAETVAPSSAPVREMGPTDADTTTTITGSTFSTPPPTDAVVTTPSPVSPAPITPVPVSPALVSPAPVSSEPTEGFPTMSPVEADKPAPKFSAVEQAIGGTPNGATTLGTTLAAMSVACIIFV